MTKVLFVCLGNICRSPMAHGIFRDKVLKKGLHIEIESAGTSAYHLGEHADKRAIATLRAKGIDIMDLRSREFVASDFDYYDYIFTMDESNQKNLLKIKSNKAAIPHMIMDLVRPGEHVSVPDPYYGGNMGFENVYQMLDEALEMLIQKLEV